MTRSKSVALGSIALFICLLGAVYAEQGPPLADVQEVLSGFQSQAAAIRQRAAEETQALRQRTIAQLQPIQDKYTRAAQLDEALAVREQIRRLQAGQDPEMAPPAINESSSPQPSSMRGRTGESFVCRITGRTTGSLWGTDVYTDDSDVATAAVHTGALRNGETGLVKVTILPPQANYPGVQRNGVTSSSWGSWPSSFRVESADWAGGTIRIPAADALDPNLLMSMANTAGQTFVFDVTGTTDGYLWGSEIYTTDSKLSTAAVHAGILQPGQSGRIRVTIFPGRESYPGVARHGITSHPWGSYPLSYSMRRD